MKAMILAAGRGTRLLPLTETLPKPMIPISSEPLIVHQIRWLKRAGINEVVINLHHLGEQIRGHLGSGAHLGVKINYSVEDELLDTGGGIVRALPLLGPERFVVLNADVWTNYRFMPKPDQMDSRIHLVLVDKPETREFGDFSIIDGKAVRDENAADRSFVFTGVSYIQPEVFRGYTVTKFSLRDILFDEIEQGHVTGEYFDGVWFDVGSHEQLKRLRRYLM